MKQFFSLFAGFLGFFMLGGCGILGIGKEESPPLEGARLYVYLEEPYLKADPGLFAVRTAFTSKQVLSSNWEQPGRIPSHLVGHLALAPHLKPLWTTSFGGGDDDAQILATPIVVGNYVYYIDGFCIVRALDAETGGVFWEKSLAPEEKEGYPVLGGGVSYEGGRLFVSTAYGELIALRAENGEVLWRKGLGSPSRNAPTVSDERVYVMTVDNQLEVFDARFGEELWSHSGIMEPACLLGSSVPAVKGDLVLVAYSSGEVFALQAKNGNVLWFETVLAPKRADSAATLAHIRARPVLDKNVAYLINHNGRMAALDLRNGQHLWDRDMGGIHTPAVVDDFIFQVTSHNKLVCLDKHQGRIYWTRDLPKVADFEGKGAWAGPVVAGGLLYLAGGNGQLLALDPQLKGEIKAAYSLPSGASLSPVVARKTVYILTNSGDISAFR